MSDKPKPTKPMNPVKGWTVCTERGEMVLWTLAPTRREALHLFKSALPAYTCRKSDRAVRVEIREVSRG